MRDLLVTLQILVSLALIALVLLQHGKGADAGATFGSGASQTLFGSRGSATFLSRTTAVLAALFFILSLTLTYLSRAPSQAASSSLQGSVTSTVPAGVPPAGAAATNGSAIPAVPGPAKPGTSSPSP